MNDLTPDPRLAMGGNKPPETMAEQLAREHAEELKLAEELLEAAGKVPKRIDDEDEDTQTKVAELIKKTRKLENRLEKHRETAREPHAQKIAEINGFFKSQTEPLEKARKAINEISEDWLKRKAEAEKRRLAEEEERRRAAAAEALRLAQEAERAKTASTAAAQEAERLANEAEQAKAAATSEQETAAAEFTAARAAHAQIKADMLAWAAEIAQRAKNNDPIAEDVKHSLRVDFDQKLAAARQRMDEAEATLKAARDKAIAAKQEQQRLDQERKDAERKAAAAERDRNAALNASVREEKAADKIAAKIDGPDANLARTRSLHGAVSTLSRRWTWEVLDRDKLDKNALWPFIHGDAIEVALGKWMNSQPEEKRQMAGARLEPETSGQTL
jgi:chromosome segregation ATPase